MYENAVESTVFYNLIIVHGIDIEISRIEENLVCNATTLLCQWS